MAQEWKAALPDALESTNELHARPRPLPVERRAILLFERAESLLVHIVSFFLVVLVLIALIGAVVSMREPLLHAHDYTTAVVDGVNGTFLAVILLELLHTTLSRGPISQQLQEFLIIGVTAGVRHGLELAVESPEGGSRDIVINLAINAVAVLGLVFALWLVREQLLRSGHTIGSDEE
jgi:hypothetical protein